MSLSRPSSTARDRLDRLGVLPTPLMQSWQRCLDRGHLPNERVVFDAVSANQQELALERSQWLVSAARPVIQSMARAMAHTGYFAILTDAQGIVIHVDGPIDRHDGRATQLARVGVDLSESAVGTTAIGVALRELQPVWVHRDDHFFDDTSVYSCAGAPLFGPQGLCVGMLDLTGVDVPARMALKHLVAQSARAIENSLVMKQPHALLLRLQWPGHLLGDDNDGLLALNADGMPIAANRAAIELLSIEPGKPWPPVSDLLAITPETLFDAARRRRGAIDVHLWSGLCLSVLAQAAEPLEATAIPGRHSHAVPLRDREAALIRQAVNAAQGNVAEAARALGISRATVYRKLGQR